MFNKKSLMLLSGIAAYAFYRYRKLTDQEKADPRKTIMEKGKALSDHLPSSWRDMFRRNTVNHVNTPAGF